MVAAIAGAGSRPGRPPCLVPARHRVARRRGLILEHLVMVLSPDLFLRGALIGIGGRRAHGCLEPRPSPRLRRHDARLPAARPLDRTHAPRSPRPPAHRFGRTRSGRAPVGVAGALRDRRDLRVHPDRRLGERLGLRHAIGRSPVPALPDVRSSHPRGRPSSEVSLPAHGSTWRGRGRGGRILAWMPIDAGDPLPDTPSLDAAIDDALAGLPDEDRAAARTPTDVHWLGIGIGSASSLRRGAATAEMIDPAAAPRPSSLLSTPRRSPSDPRSSPGMRRCRLQSARASGRTRCSDGPPCSRAARSSCSVA